MIRSELIALISKQNYWTLASQPAVDGAPSSHPIFGWGPPGGGFVFQKAFVEFFCSRDEWEGSLKQRLKSYGNEVLGWMKTDARGVFESSTQQDQKIDGIDTGSSKTKTTNPTSNMNANTTYSDANIVNSVTWGVFPSREIVTPTIIEAEAFRTWAQEAYAIWSEWKRCFPRGSEEAAFLDRARSDVVLINIVGHDFRGWHAGKGGRLWRILLGDDGNGK